MTATAHVYTSDGFAIAVDGRQRWGHEPSRDRHISQLESDQVQKLFEVTGRHMALAYSVKGDVASIDREFDFTAELEKTISQLRDKRFLSIRRFLEVLSGRLEEVIEEALVQGRLEVYPTTELCFVGYFRRKPCWVEVQFHRYRNRDGHLYEITEQGSRPGFCMVSGSLVVQELVQYEDPRVADFHTPLNDKTSLEDASKLVTGYIRACCSDWALELDPTCRGIGGHVHVATVTPPEPIKSRILRLFGFGSRNQTGFQWVTPPLRESSI